jgi:hypothetical protein
MRVFDFFGSGGGFAGPPAADEPALRRYVSNSRLNRVLEFTRLSIDDVVNDPIAKNIVVGYWKLSRQIDRSGEVTELERQWNPRG